MSIAIQNLEQRWRQLPKSGGRGGVKLSLDPRYSSSPLATCTVVPHLYGPQLYSSPDYTDPILPQINDIHRIFGVH